MIYGVISVGARLIMILSVTYIAICRSERARPGTNSARRRHQSAMRSRVRENGSCRGNCRRNYPVLITRRNVRSDQYTAIICMGARVLEFSVSLIIDNELNCH